MKRTTLPRLTDLKDASTLEAYLRLALQEDGAWDDATTGAVIPRSARARAVMTAKESGVFCGGAVAERLFHILNRRLRVRRIAEGRQVKRGQQVMTIEGPLRPILAAERTALNFVQRLSGVATMARRFVEAIGERRVALLDTRKTTPLWRALERHAVRVGGGKSHRFALDDMIMIKDNHADAVGGVGRAVRMARVRRPDLRLAAEARSLAEACEAAEAGADVVMLDNMTVAQVRRAVQAIGGRAQIEVTGGVTLRRAGALARAGVHRLSVGALTHSAEALDFSLSLAPERRRRRPAGKRR